jgi:hypothetical protein
MQGFSSFGGVPKAPDAQASATSEQVDLIARLFEILRSQNAVSEDPVFWASCALSELATCPEKSLQECVQEANARAGFFVAQKRIKEAEEKRKTLVEAIQSGSVEAAERALQKGADVNRGEQFTGIFPLNVALSHGSLPMVRLLLEHGADVNSCDALRGAVTAQRGAQEEREEIFKLVAAKLGTTWEREDILGLCATGDNTVLLQWMLNNMSQAARETHLERMLCNACCGINLEHVKLLVARGAPVHAKSRTSPIVLAVANVRADMVAFFASLADFDAQAEYEGRSLLDILLSSNHLQAAGSVEITALLVERKCPVAQDSIARLRSHLSNSPMERFRVNAEPILALVSKSKRSKK